jgi:uncharacterized protein YeaO (DUF488 family)
MSGSQHVRVGRVYDERAPGEGTRVLVDRLWPRGIRKDDPRIDEWMPEVAPSKELRSWYGHEPSLFAEFSGRYEHELGGGEQSEALATLRDLARGGPVTLLTATRDVAHSQAVVLARLLEPPA